MTTSDLHAEWVRANGATWPGFAEPWMGETYVFPSGRGQEPPSRGWECPGCLRCYSPAVRECPFCQPQAHAPRPAPEAGAGCNCCPEDP